MEHLIRGILDAIGEDSNRDGLKDTPSRVVKSWKELYAGYNMDPASVMTTFDEMSDEMVILTNVSFASQCEHHMLPFVGVAHIAYLPDKRVIGVSKLVRLLEIYTKRLQIQERICQQVTGALDEFLQPLGSACVLEASHQCMSCRGVRKEGSVMITSSLTGEFKNDDKCRNEFLHMIRRK